MEPLRGHGEEETRDGIDNLFQCISQRNTLKKNGVGLLGNNFHSEIASKFHK